MERSEADEYPWTWEPYYSQVPKVTGCYAFVEHAVATVPPERWASQRLVVFHTLRAACTCGWHGEIVGDENAAAEEAVTHAFPNWRSLPAIEMPRGDDLKALEKLRTKIAHLYPPDWPERRGPSISWRDKWGGRHVPGRGLFGGYDMGRKRAQAEDSDAGGLSPTPVERVAQATLF